MPDNDAPSREKFAALSSRVDAMESGGGPLATVAAADPVAALDQGQPASRTRYGDVSLASPLLHLGLPSYLAASLTQVEDALLRRDIALHAGDDGLARELEERSAGVACVALTRAADDLQMPSGVSMEESDSNFLRNGDGLPALQMPTFREQELHVLCLVGLSQELATKHLEGAVEVFQRSTISIRTEEDLRRALKVGADAACATHELLGQGRRMAEGARQRRRRLRQVLVPLGSAVITAANPLALPFVGPVAVGVSMVLGAGAAGAAANVFED